MPIALDETVTTRSVICGSSRFVSANGPRWLVANCSSKPSAERPSGTAMIPALFTKTSMGCCHFSANSRTDVRLARSSGQTSTSPCMSAAARRPRSSSRTAKITRAPLRTSAAAVTRPIPLLAPVTITVRPDCGGIRSAVHLVTTVNLVGGPWPPGSVQFGRGQDQRFRAVGDWLGQTDQRDGSDDAGVGHHAVDDPLKVGVGARHDSAPEVARSGDGPALQDLRYLRQPGG